MQVEHRILVNAPAEKLFRIYADVANWCQWDPDTKASFIDGPFVAGAKGRLTPTKGNAVPMVLTSVQPNAHFTAESRIPLFCMVFEHELLQSGTATQVIHRVGFSGLLTPLLGRWVGAQVNKGLPITLSRLKALAESAA
ncbi:MAG: SRPBCC family protein [Xanthomonadaceae bacterium]|nr:SRPBCC family protein [Xanthomonadaceae bacterium]